MTGPLAATVADADLDMLKADQAALDQAIGNETVAMQALTVARQAVTTGLAKVDADVAKLLLPPIDPPDPPTTGTRPRKTAIWLPGQGGDNTVVRCMWHNMPLGAGVRGDGRKLNGPYWNVNYDHYGWSRGTFPKPPHAVTTTVGAGVGIFKGAIAVTPGAFKPQLDNVENHVSLIDINALIEYCYYEYGLTPVQGGRKGEQMSGSWNMLQGVIPNVNMGASGMPHAPGVITLEDINDPDATSTTPFWHAIHCGLEGVMLDKRAVDPATRPLAHVAPAFRVDGNPSGYAGWVRIGDRIFIPPGTSMPSGLNKNQQRLHLTLQVRGGIVHDRGSAILAQAECAGAVGGNQIALLNQCEVITNEDKSGVIGAALGGPGVRLAPYVPLFAAA